MNAPQKFLFETSFEPEDQPKEPVEPPPEPKYFDEDLERALSEGHAAGLEAGRGEAMEAIEQAAARALEAIAACLPELERSLNELQERQTRSAVEVSAALVRKMFPNMVREHGLAEIDAVVSEAMARLRDEPRIVIRVDDTLLDPVKARVGELAKSSGFEGRIVFLAQDGMAVGDVRVEWADGGAERDTERTWQDIDELIRRMSGAPDTPNEAAQPTTETTGSHGTTA